VLHPLAGPKEFTFGPMFATMVFAFEPECLCQQMTPLNAMVEDLAHNLVESVWKFVVANRGTPAMMMHHMEKFAAALRTWCKANAEFFTQHFMVWYMRCINKGLCLSTPKESLLDNWWPRLVDNKENL
jgi:hypothetical protein